MHARPNFVIFVLAVKATAAEASAVRLTGSGAVSPPKPRTPVRHLATVDDFEDFLQHSGYQTSPARVHGSDPPDAECQSILQ